MCTVQSGRRLLFALYYPIKNSLIFTRETLYAVGKTKGFVWKYEGWDFNSGNYLFTTDTK